MGPRGRPPTIFRRRSGTVTDQGYGQGQPYGQGAYPGQQGQTYPAPGAQYQAQGAE